MAALSTTSKLKAEYVQRLFVDSTPADGNVQMALRRSGVTEGKARRMRFHTFDPQRQLKAYKAVLLWTLISLEGQFPEDGGWLFLQGPNGLGKTHLAISALAAIVLKWAEKHFPYVPGLYLDWAKVSSGYDEWDRVEQDASDAPVLLVDDLTKRGATRWSAEQLYELVNHRDMFDLQTIFTSNVPLAELFEFMVETSRPEDRRAVASAANAIIGRIQQRLWDPRPETPASWAVPFRGDDYRTMAPE
jgi:DNA replication protein DnaC